MKKHLILFAVLLASIVIAVPVSAKKKNKKGESAAASLLLAAKGEKSDTATYNKELKDFQAKEGMFKVHEDKTGKVYFEVPETAFAHTYLLVNRVSNISNTSDYVAGQMCTAPILVRLSHDYSNVFLHKVQSDAVVDADDPIKPAFDRAFVDPILKGFKIKARTDSTYVIDVTAFFGENERSISPIRPDNPLGKLLSGNSGLKGTFNASGSCINEVKVFPQNIQIRSTLSYVLSSNEQPYTVQLCRSLVQLPDDPMPSRLQDNRVGYFDNYKRYYTSQKDKVEEYNIIHRWRLTPKPEDMDRYFAGELVEPQKKIIYYVDSAFPEKWAGAVREGIEYWNTAFEAAGFKNAVEARMYPKDDPTFDPDDARYSCIRYCATTTANAAGPSYVDPRTGEILMADVIWYHNILSLVHNWKFVQTGAVDPRVRKTVFDDATMYEALTYVAAHEVGHTLGLMHNMGASYAFTIDNLRDPEFTQKHGTTPSIMDYARNNYVAQPGDYERGVKLTPPSIGVYDIYAINWGYRLIPGARNMFDEKSTLDQWIRAKQGDPMYEFGAQQFLGLVDPTDQTEDLSNDQITAGTMSISNLKIIMDHIEEWAMDKGERYDNLISTYKALIQQFNRHIGHVMPYIGGIIYREVRQGQEDGYAQNYVPKAKTKEAMEWLLTQVRTSQWLDKPSVVDKLEEVDNWRFRMEQNVVACLFNSRGLRGIKDGYERNPEVGYKLHDYMNDAYTALFRPTLKNQPLNQTERHLQSAAVDIFMRASGLAKTAAATKSAAFAEEQIRQEYFTYQHDVCACDLPCSHTETAGSDDFLRIVMNLPTMPAEEYQPMMAGYLRKVLSLYKAKVQQTHDRETQDFYSYQITKITNFFDK